MQIHLMRFSETLRTFPLARNTGLKVPLKFLLFLRKIHLGTSMHPWAPKCFWKSSVKRLLGCCNGLRQLRTRHLARRTDMDPSARNPGSWQLRPGLGWGLGLRKRAGRGSAGRTSTAWSEAGGLFSLVALLWSQHPRDGGGSWVPPCSCSFQLPFLHPSCTTRLPPRRKRFFQHAVSHETSFFIVPVFAQHLACQMLLQIKDGSEPKSRVQTPSNFGKVCIPILWLCSIPASFQSYLVRVFIFFCNQKLQRNVIGTEWVDVPWENSKTLPGWRHAPSPWSIYWSYKKDYSMDESSPASRPFLHSIFGHTFHIKIKYLLPIIFDLFP